MDRPYRSGEESTRILDREIFLYFLDLEVKRARRYQNFFSVLIVRLNQTSNRDDGRSLHSCYQKLSHLLIEDLRESEILGSLEEDRLAALLPYADFSAGASAKSRFEGSLKYLDFENEGYEVSIDQICFPMDGTDIADLTQRVMGRRAA